ncbi:tetratricopeptide repeat protein [Thermodesulfobacteriota bacterium]
MKSRRKKKPVSKKRTKTSHPSRAKKASKDRKDLSLFDGIRYQEEGRFEEAIAVYRLLIQSQPRNPELYFFTGLAYAESQKFDEAISFLNRAIDLKPNFPEVVYNMGVVYSILGKENKAESCYRKISSDDSFFWRAQLNLGTLLGKQDKSTEAIACYKNVIERSPSVVEATYNIGVEYETLSDYETAIEYYQKAIRVNPEFGQAYAAVGSICEKRNDYSKAEEWSLKALRYNPALFRAYLVLGKVKKARGDFTNALKLFEKVLELDQGNKETLYELGYCCEKLKKYDEAFHFFKLANSYTEASPIEKEDFLSQISELRTIYRSHKMPISGTVEVDKSKPVFIIGCPRSGTTLLDQILDSHPRLKSVGECDHIFSTVKALPRILGRSLSYPDALGYLLETSSDERKKLTDHIDREYWEIHNRSRTPDAARIVDKSLINTLYLGLIGLILPRAAVLHVIRDGRDVAWSAFSTNLKKHVWHANRIEDAFIHWKQTLQVAREASENMNISYLEVCYEDLLQEPETQIRKVLAFIEEDWHSDCLEFYKNKRDVYTASYDQVRKNIYRSSVGRAGNYKDQYAFLSDTDRVFLREWGYRNW